MCSGGVFRAAALRQNLQKVVVLRNGNGERKVADGVGFGKSSVEHHSGRCTEKDEVG